MPGKNTNTTENEALQTHRKNLVELRERIARATPDRVEAMLKEYPPQRDHIVQLSNAERSKLHEWMARPNGSLSFGRVCFEAVVGGGLLVRTNPY